MGKHKKFLKSEKAKVKLKGTKLKAPQNVTKTDFKVRKIVITEQLRNVQVKEPGTRKIHSVNDCLARLKNSSSAEAISNLKDIILGQPEDFQKHLESIIKVVANLSLSIEKNDRKECFKILDLICAQTIEQNMRPFFPILVTFLKCALTHIKPAIQQDSLLMLDVLLKHAPQLVASEKDNILRPYLDMVSKMRFEEKPERTLSLQLGNKIISMKWRKSVLERLIVFLKCIATQDKENQKCALMYQSHHIPVNQKDEYLGNLYTQQIELYFQNNIPISAIERHLKTENNQQNASNVKISKYIDMIMPLMFETWVELKPTQKSSVDNENSTSISHEDSIMLRIIMDIITELFRMIESTNDEMKQKFLQKNLEKFELHFVSSFPYYQNDSSPNSQESGGPRCLYQNLSISIIYLAFVSKHRQRFWKHRQRIFAFVKDCILKWKLKDVEFNKLMKKFIRLLFSNEVRKVLPHESKEIFDELIQKCNADQSSYDPKLALVCEIIEKSKSDKKASIYAELVPQLVQVLSQKEFIPIHIIKTVSTLAKQGNQVVYENLENTIYDIIKHLLSGVKISGSFDSVPHTWRHEIANLIFWVNDKEILTKINLNLGNDPTSRYIQEIIKLKLNSC
ncbi:CLUMA_CG020286, isoform A [Clunio marinus]|uniref:CLUMA_CG020286, isoform A n=1 Tax=Clunio marinus TaxID=568069 RepID=A0A1J1J6A4_9DIPT|nr:CLUMA_CG020286, isoform A [Clunio marinus]